MKRLILVALGALMLNSCDTDVVNPNAITAQTFWKTEADAQYGINATYNMFYKPGMFTRWLWFRLDLTSDEGFSTSPWAELKEWTQFTYNNYNFWEGNRWSYQTTYEAIYRANQVIANVPNIEFADENEKELILAQAHYLRGMWYYYLAVLWGSENPSLAIMLEPSQPQDQPAGHTGEEVFNQAIADLTIAADKLPEAWDGANVGRATKGAAMAFRAKCYMQMRNFTAAQTDLEWFVDGAGAVNYDLSADYHDNFNIDGENSKESIFEIQYSDVHTAPAGDGDFAVDPNLGQNRGQFFAPPGVGWTDGELRPWLVDEFKKEKDLEGNYDVRLKWTAYYEGMNVDFPGNEKIYRWHLDGADAAQWEQDNWKGRVFFRKYDTSFYRDIEDYHNPVNIRIIRYADILLMYAECLAENGDVAKAVQQVDRVRARVNMPALSVNHADATGDATSFLKRLQMERSMELASEGHRWADLKRWGMLDTQEGIDELASRDADFNNFVIGKHLRLPIPSMDVNNNPNIKQNPNY